MLKKNFPTTSSSKGAASPSSSSYANVICHRCKGMGHLVLECPSKRAYIAIDDGGYVSARDGQKDFVLATNLDAGKFEDSPEDSEIIDSVACTTKYQAIIVQRVLNTQGE